LKCRGKIKRAVDKSLPVEVTERRVQIWFNIINTVIFKNELPKFTEIQITNCKQYHAMCECEGDQYKLSINSAFESKKRFLEVMVHEMIHLYDWVNYEQMNHGKLFFSWREKTKKYGLDLYKAY
jgi:hypothetical protein